MYWGRMIHPTTPLEAEMPGRERKGRGGGEHHRLPADGSQVESRAAAEEDSTRASVHAIVASVLWPD
jgi:hypothetical protein